MFELVYENVKVGMEYVNLFGWQVFEDMYGNFYFGFDVVIFYNLEIEQVVIVYWGIEGSVGWD